MNKQIKELHNDIITRLSVKFDQRTASTLSYLILESIYGFSRSKIIAFSDTLVKECDNEIDIILANLLKDMPIEYTLGYREFYGREFVVTKDVLIPRPETEELVRLIIEQNKGQKSKILDIGSGSGAICVTLAAEIEGSDVVGLDVSCEALKIARVNAEKFSVKNIAFYECDILKCDRLMGMYDIIVSNPPYVTSAQKNVMSANVLDYEPHLALFVDDSRPLVFYEKIADLAVISLNKGGTLYFEINECFKSEMITMLELKGFKDVYVVDDMFGKPRMAVAKLI